MYAGALASQEANQDPIDLAFQAVTSTRRVLDNFPRATPVSFAPFDARSRCTEAVIELGGKRLRVLKGAVRTLAEACAMLPAAIEALDARVSESAAKGHRALAVTRGPESSTPTLIGLVTLFDPSRPDAEQLIAALRGLGVSGKMLAGDALAIARETAHSGGLLDTERVSDLKTASALAGNEAVDLPAGANGFAEVYPEGKYFGMQHACAGGHQRGLAVACGGRQAAGGRRRNGGGIERLVRHGVWRS